MNSPRFAGALALLLAAIVLFVPSTMAEDTGMGDGWRVNGSFQSEPLITANGSVYIKTLETNSYGASVTSGLMALSPEGEVMWTYPLAGTCSGYTVDDSGTVYLGELDPYYGLQASTLVAIGADGQVMWRVNSSTDIPAPPKFKAFGAPALASDGSIVVTLGEDTFFGVERSKGYPLLCFYPNGTLKWRYQLPGGYASIIPAEGPSSDIWVVSNYSKLLCLTSEGKLSWTLDVGSLGYTLRNDSAARPDGTFCALVYHNGSLGAGEIWKVGSGGSVQWKFSPFAEQTASYGVGSVLGGAVVGPLFSNDGRAFFTTQRCTFSNSTSSNGGVFDSKSSTEVPGKIYALSADGILLWSHDEGAADCWPLSIADGHLYCVRSNYDWSAATGDYGLVAYWLNGTIEWRSATMALSDGLWPVYLKAEPERFYYFLYEPGTSNVRAVAAVSELPMFTNAKASTDGASVLAISGVIMATSIVIVAASYLRRRHR